MRWFAVAYIMGWLIAAFGAFMAIPALVSWSFHDPDMPAFAITSLASMFAGVLLIFMNRADDFYLNHRDGVLITCCAWVGLSIIGAIPLYFSGAAPSWVDAIFEATSGLTTTGATVFSNIDEMGHGVKLWRMMMQWLGGMGIVVLAVAVLPFLGIGGLQLYRSEMPGVTKDKLQPRMKETARLLWFIYVFLTVLCAGSYWLAGMDFFDAITHSFTTVATAGFSTHDDSFRWFGSASIEMVAILFMIIGGINFTFHFQLLSGKGFHNYFKDKELQAFLVIILAATLYVTGILYFNSDYTWLEALRKTAFNIVSITTTTGYSTDDFSLWPPAAMVFVIVLMFVGGCSGSTAGGMKVLRVLLLLKQGGREMFRLIHPSGIRYIKLGNFTIPEKVVQAVWAFAGVYLATFVFFTLVLATFGLDLVTAFSASAACVTNLGPALGSVGPFTGYSAIPDGAKLALCLAMLLGRLEIFTLLLLITPAFWRT